MEDLCQLCKLPMNDHFVLTEDRTIDGKKSIVPTGWGCPYPDLDKSNLVEHAKLELKRLGEEPYTVSGYLAIMQIFANMGHSGGSASVFIPVLSELMQFRNLTPLTDDPDEWMHISDEMWGSPGGIWQSTRRPEAFSNDGGKTYYMLSEGGNDKNRKPIHASVKEACWRFHPREECKPGQNHPVVMVSDG